MSMDSFPYTTLEDSQVRLLILHPSQNPAAAIKCDLEVYDSDKAPPFEALSWDWGSMEYTRCIYLRSHKSAIYENLYDALRSLRDVHTTRILWIDTLCINQLDASERGVQSERSKNIFAKAEKVVAYLGKATASTNALFDYLMKIEDSGKEDALSTLMSSKILSEEEDLISQGLQHIFLSAWFRRSWKFKEVLHSRAAVVQCGLKAVSIQTFAFTARSVRELGNSSIFAYLDLEIILWSHGNGQRVPRIDLFDLLQQFKDLDAARFQDKMLTLLDILKNVDPNLRVIPDHEISGGDLRRMVTANLCLCELSSVSPLHYRTIDHFLSNLKSIDGSILKKILESSKEMKLELLIQHGLPYIKWGQYLIEAASCNKTRGDEMIEILRRDITPERSISPTYFASGSSNRVPGHNSIPDTNGLEESLVDHADGINGDSDQPLDANAGSLYLLLCVNTRNLTKLLQIDLRQNLNDQYLFDTIRRRYWEARRHNSLHLAMLIPRPLMDRMPLAWETWLESLHLRVPQSADLIEFRLVPYRGKLCPQKIKLTYPPKDQVKANNYHYHPYPSDSDILSIPEFSHLLKPGFHSYNYWCHTFPKKLQGELEHKPYMVGWGLIINETWDWVIVFSCVLALMILVGVAVILDAVFVYDQASAFGFVTYVVAIIMLLVTVGCWEWQEREVS